MLTKLLIFLQQFHENITFSNSYHKNDLILHIYLKKIKA